MGIDFSLYFDVHKSGTRRRWKEGGDGDKDGAKDQTHTHTDIWYVSKNEK